MNAARGVRPFEARQDLEREGQKSISGEDGHSLPKDLVAGGTPAPQIVIIERRQVVMN